MVQQANKVSSNEMQTKVYADVSDLGEYVIIRQGDDMVMIPAAPGTADTKAAAVAQSLGV